MLFFHYFVYFASYIVVYACSIINNMEGIVNITPIGDAPTYINGNLITEPTMLHHVSGI